MVQLENYSVRECSSYGQNSRDVAKKQEHENFNGRSKTPFSILMLALFALTWLNTIKVKEANVDGPYLTMAKWAEHNAKWAKLELRECLNQHFSPLEKTFYEASTCLNKFQHHPIWLSRFGSFPT